MRTFSYRPITTSLLLVGAMFLLAGCGDPGAHLPASMSGGSASSSLGGTSILDTDPGPVGTTGVSTMVDDPVLAGYDGIDSVSTLSSDDPFTHAVNDWNESEGALSGAVLNDAPLPDVADYGYGGYDDGYGYGYGGLALASYGNGGILSNAIGGWGNAGLMDAGLLDGGLGFEDPLLLDDGLDSSGFVNTGFDGFDPVFDGPTGVDMLDDGFIDPGFDAGFVDQGFADPGFVDPGFVDPGFVDAGFDAGGFVDTGFDGGFVDAGVADFGGGGFDVGGGFDF